MAVRDCKSLEELSRAYTGLVEAGERAVVPTPLTPEVFVEVLERAVALRGGPVLPWDLNSSPSPLALSTSTSDAPYLDSLRGTLLEATGKASFRLDPREYERVLSALRDLGEDDTELHNGLARGFVWDATLEKPPRQQPFQRFQQQDQAQQQQLRRRKEERELALRVYAEALSSGVIVSRVVASERLAGGWKGGTTASTPSIPSEADLKSDAVLVRTLTALSTQARERVCTFMGDQGNHPSSFPPPSVLLSTSHLFSTPPSSSSFSAPQGAPLPIWLRTLFSQRAASRLFTLANRSINHKLGAKASKSPASLGRAAIKVALMTPLAEAAVCCTSALFRQCAVEVGVMEEGGKEGEQMGGGGAGAAKPKHLLRRWGSQQPSSFPQSHPLVLATSAIIQTLTKCVSTALPVEQIHDFWAAKATEKSAGVGASPRNKGSGVFPASSYSLFYGIGATHAYSSSSSASSSSSSSSSEGGEALESPPNSTQSNYRTHDPVHALGAHVHDWAPPLLTAIALWLECGLAVAPYTSFVSLDGVVALPQPQPQQEGVGDEREGGKVAWIGGIRRETRVALVDALEAIKMCARAITLHYAGVGRCKKHLRHSWGSWCKITESRAAADAAAAAAAAAAATTDDDDGGMVAAGEDITVTHDSATLDMYAVGAIRDPSSGGGGVGGDGGGLHPKYACAIAATSLAPAVLHLLTLLHPLVVSVEGMVGGGAAPELRKGGGSSSSSSSGNGDSSGTSNEILGAIEEVLGVCSWASRTLSPVHPLLYYTTCYDSGGAGRHLGATHTPHLAAQWLRSVASGVRLLGWEEGQGGSGGKGGGARKVNLPPKAAAIVRNLRWEAVRVASAGLVSPPGGGGGDGGGSSSSRPFWWPVRPPSSSRGEGGVAGEVLGSFQTLGINPDTLFLPSGGGGSTGEGGSGTSSSTSSSTSRSTSRSTSSGVITPPLTLPWGALPRASITSPPWAIHLATLVNAQEKGGAAEPPLSNWGNLVPLKERL